jgi:hypothetical protein
MLIEIFVSQDELDSIVRELAQEADLKALLFAKGGYRSYDPSETPSELLTTKDRVDSIFLIPRAQKLPAKLSDDTVRPREKGWIQVDPGGLVEWKGQKVLTSSTFNGEDRKNAPYKPSNPLRRLKRRLASTLTLGVTGKDVKFGDKSVFKDIGYSKEALRLHREGVLWKQHPDYNVVFDPIKK